MDGTSPITFSGTAGGDYFVSVRHRNHLGVMTAAVPLSTTSPLIDFTESTTATYGTNAQCDKNGVLTLWAGNAELDGAIDANDRSKVWNNRNTAGYMSHDINLDGTCNAVDRSKVWNNRNK